MEKYKRGSADLIVDEEGARKHFRELKAAGFEIYEASLPLTEAEFVVLALQGGVVFAVRQVNDWGGTGSSEERTVVGATEEAARDFFGQTRDCGMAIFLPQEQISEDGFIQLAAQRGRVNLRRVSPVNGKITVSYGTEIGFSRQAAGTVMLGGRGDYVM